MVSPSRVSAVLRRVASRIDGGTRPDKDAVTLVIRRVLAAMERKASGDLTVGQLKQIISELPDDMPVWCDVYPLETVKVESGALVVSSAELEDQFNKG